MSSTTLDFEVSVNGREKVRLRLQLDGDQILEGRLEGIGCTEMLTLLAEWRPKLRGRMSELELPLGSGHAEMLIRELILKAQGRWDFPYTDEELCHCRAVPTKKVDESILNGCHSVAAISRACNAGTQCGTCRPDIEKVLNYRIKSDRIKSD